MWVARRLLPAAQRSHHAVRSELLGRPGCFPDVELRYLQCTCCWRSRVPVAGSESLNASSMSSSQPCDEDGRSLNASSMSSSQPCDEDGRSLNASSMSSSQPCEEDGRSLNASMSSSQPCDEDSRSLNASSMSSSQPCEEDGRSLDACYTPEQRHAILHLLNTASLAQLAAVKLLRGRKSANIVEYRNKHGAFSSLESVVNVPLLKHKSAVTVFNSILNPVRKEKKVRIQLAKFIRPEVDRSWLEDANSIVSLVCGTNKVAWAHVDRGMTVLDWQQLECPHFLKGTYMASSYLNDVSSVVTLLPPADFYIVEKPSMSVQNTALFPVMAHMRTVEAMLFALIEPRNVAPQANVPPRVLNMMRTAVGRHFGLMVGESRTSGAQTVRRLMTDSVTQKLPRVNFPPELLVKYRNYFHMGSRREGEELSDALLQALAFYELLGDASTT